MKRLNVGLGGVGILMMAAGACLGVVAFLIQQNQLKKKYEEEFDQRLEVEVEQTKEYYRRLNKKEEFSDPNKLAESYVEEESAEDGPTVITADDFVKTFTEYEKITLTYFEEDDILTDGDDKPLDIDGLIGLGSLEKFGHGTKDRDIVYVRNVELETDFEVIKSKGNYAKDVLGFVEHSEPRGRPRKFRRDYE